MHTNKAKSFLLFLSILICLFSCKQVDPNLDKKGEDELKSHEITKEINLDKMAYEDVLYVPIYSDIYADVTNQKSLLAATLSIRNTSNSDSIFISVIDYFNTEGALVRKYLDNTISIQPMGTVNYVIEREDESGGSGANFIVEIFSTNAKVKPLVQAIMIGQTGNKGFAFSTDGYSIK